MTHSVSTLSTKVFYGSGAAAFGIKDAGFNYFLLIYYNQVLGLDAFLTGLALALAVAIDAVSDLAVGHLSDHWHSKWGRRHPFMFAAILPVVITFYLLWNPPEFAIATDSSLFIYLFVMAVLVRSGITLFEVPNAALGPELTKDYDDRTRLMAFRYLFGWLGGLTIAVLTYMVLIPSDAAGQMGPNGYQLLGVVGSGAMLIMMLFSSLGTTRHIQGLHKPDIDQPALHSIESIKRLLAHFKEMFRNPSFVAVFISALFFGAASGLSQALSIYISTFFWGLSSGEIGYIPLLGLIAVPISFTLAPRLAQRFGKKEAAMYAFFFAIAFLPIAYLAQLSGLFPERGNPIYLPLIMLNYLIETTAIITMQIVFASMNADIVEDRSAESDGRRDEGLIYAARNFAKKAVSGLGVMLAGIVLWIANFPEQAQLGQVDTASVHTLILVYLPVFMTLYLASWYILRNYRIDKDKHEANITRVSSNVVLED
jgi:GPH family glycoside/pentoside/hexuronide:cation symporter